MEQQTAREWIVNYYQSLLRVFQVEAEDLDDFLDRFYKYDRYKGRGDGWCPNYADLIKKDAVNMLKNYGVTWISCHDSRTGEVVSFYG